MNRMDRLAEAIERLVCAKTNEIWMSIVIGFGLVMLVVWGFQAVCFALREFGRANGVM